MALLCNFMVEVVGRVADLSYSGVCDFTSEYVGLFGEAANALAVAKSTGRVLEDVVRVAMCINTRRGNL
jgi:hypothetical protein